MGIDSACLHVNWIFHRMVCKIYLELKRMGINNICYNFRILHLWEYLAIRSICY